MTESSHLPRVLIVDDVPGNIKMLASILADFYDLSFATSGAEAMELLEHQETDLILLDVVMPEMNGYLVLQHLKADERWRDIPIIFLTAKNSPEDEVLGLQLGAVDYITKPFTPAVVKARVNTQLKLQRMNRQLLEITNELLNERNFIESVVQTMLGPVEITHAQMRYWTKPVEKTSGDLLLVTEGTGQTQFYVLGDITGHGLSSAVVGPIISYIFYSMADRGSKLPDIINELNHYLVTKLPPNVFLTACFIGVNLHAHRLEVWNCAMPDVVVFREGKPVLRLSSHFQPLGILKSPYSEPKVVDLLPSDRIFFLSDGLVEVHNAQGQELGMDRLIAIMTDMVRQNQPLQYVHEQILKYNESGRQKDDMTIAEITLD
ncbi:MAG: fused response regulator/phosphatase [Magnetococcales bacterium]|nr:fused response regulator/phosphatase [Magnetococcales bacterium]